MAETAGLALGVVALGIEVCKGIITYADAVRSQTDDLNALERQAQILATTLDLIGKTVQCLRTTANNTTSARTVSGLVAVRNSMKACELDLKVLQDFIVEHAGCSVASPGFRDRCRDGYKVFKYGFRGAKRAEMEQRITTVNSVLSLAMQNLDIDMSIEQAATLARLQSQAGQASVNLEGQGRVVGLIQNDTSDILRKLDNLQTNITNIDTTIIGNEVRKTAAVVIEKVDALSTRMETIVMSQENSVALRMLKLTETIEARTAYLDNTSSEQRDFVTAARLIARPSILEEAAALRENHPTLALSNRKRAICECQIHHTIEKWHVQSGINLLSFTSRQTVQHSPLCQYSRGSGKNNQEDKAIRARLLCFGRAIEVALRLSFEGRQGSGGFSLSPSFKHHLVVDEKRAPAFRVLYIVYRCLSHFYYYLRPKELDVERLLLLTQVKLRQIFISRRASPTDTTQAGCNIVSHLARIIGMTRDHGVDFGPLLAELAHHFGVPLDQVDKDGELPLFLSLREGSDRAVYSMDEMLMPSSSDLPVAGSCWEFNTFERFSQVCRAQPTAYDVFNIDPLSAAIIRNQALKAVEMVQKYPGYLKLFVLGRNYGYLELSLRLRHCFLELLTATDECPALTRPELQSSLQALLSKTDFLSPSLFTIQKLSLAEIALLSCDRSDRRSSEPCWHSNALSALFNKGATFRLATLNDLRPECDACISVCVGELKRRRQRIRELALEKLPPSLARVFELAEVARPLDRHVSVVIQHLLGSGIHVESSLGLEMDGELPQPVYGYCCPTARFAEALYKAGFQDIDALSDYGTTALQQKIQGTLHWYNREWELILWLSNHSPAPLESVLSAPWKTSPVYECRCLQCKGLPSSSSRPSVAHILLVAAADLIVGSDARILPEQDNYTAKVSLVRSVISFTIYDSAECKCSPLGRTPLIYFLLSGFSSVSNSYGKTLEDLAAVLERLLLICGDLMTLAQYQSIFRTTTYEALPLAHTCSSIHFNKITWSESASGSDTASMCDQDDVLELFNQICDEFDSHVADMFSSLARENAVRGGAEAETARHFGDLFVSKEAARGPPVNRQIAQMTTHETKWRGFLQLWIDMVRQALDNLHRDSVESGHMAASEALGVVWAGQSGAAMVSPIVSPGTFDGWEADDWYYAIENI